MGYKIEFNWVLKLEKNQKVPPLKIGKVYNFKKQEERIYPLHIPIGLCHDKSRYDILAKIEILEFKVSKNKTEGKYKIIELGGQND
jgi:hypothetical protein